MLFHNATQFGQMQGTILQIVEGLNSNANCLPDLTYFKQTGLYSINVK